MCCGDLCLLWLVDTKWGEDFTYFIHRCRGCKCHWWQLPYLGHDRTVIVCHLLCRRTEILKIWNKIGLKMSFTVYERPCVHEAEICAPCLPPYSIATVWLFFQACQSNPQPRTCQHPRRSLIHHRLMCCDSKAEERKSNSVQTVVFFTTESS